MYSRFGEQKGQRQLWAMTWKIQLNVAKTNSPKGSSLNDSEGPMAPIGSFNPAISGITGLKVSSQSQGID